MKSRLDIKITDLLGRLPFTLSAEILPPRNGVAPEALYAQIEGLRSAGAQYIAVTKGAGGSLRAGSLPIAQTIKETFAIPCIAHFTCRDLAPEEVENQLIDHHLFGIRNILALRGDPPQGMLDWRPRAGSHSFAYQLIEQIMGLNQGVYLGRKGFEVKDRQKTDFCIGAACYPDSPTKEERVGFFEKKVAAGATFAISQMLFDADSYARFADETSHLNVPILPGTRLLKSQEHARKVGQRFVIPIGKDYLAALPATDAEATPERSLEAFMRLAEALKRRGSPGIHIFVLADHDLAQVGLRRLQGMG